MNDSAETREHVWEPIGEPDEDGCIEGLTSDFDKTSVLAPNLRQHLNKVHGVVTEDLWDTDLAYAHAEAHQFAGEV